MKIQKAGLLKRVRTVLTALVVIAGFGTSLMAMKPVEKAAAFTYGVSETSGGMHYQIQKNVTGLPRQSWNCDEATTACTIASNIVAPAGSLILKSQGTVLEVGDFSSN